MISNMIIKVEFLAGTELEEAIKDAKIKAGNLDLAYICFDFNGTSFSIGRNADIANVIEEWKDGDNKYGICSA